MTLELGLKTYDSKDVLISINNFPLLSGFSDDKITVEFDNDSYTHKSDVDGKLVVRDRNNDQSATVKLYVMQKSSVNDILNTFLQADRINNKGVFQFTMSELNGADIVQTSFAYILKPPSLSKGKESGVHEWTIKIPKPNVKYGAGATPSVTIAPPIPGV